MRSISVLTIAVALSGIFFAARAEDCHLTRYASLDVKLDAALNPMIPMSISGHQLYMLVDTGGIYSMLTERRVKELGLTQSAVHGVHFSSGGHQLDSYVVVKDVTFGHVAVTGSTQMLVMPDDLAAPDVDGTLAPDYLSFFDVEIDLARAKINLFAPNRCDASPVYWVSDGEFAILPLNHDSWGHILLNVELDGKPLVAELDTGASITFMSLESMKDVFGIDENNAALQTAAEPRGADHFYRYPFKTLALGGVTVLNPSITLNNGHYHGGPRMVIGMNILRQLHLYISYKNAKAYATAAGATELNVDGKAGLWEDRLSADLSNGPGEVRRICATQEQAQHPLSLVAAAAGCTRGPVTGVGQTVHFELSCPGDKRFDTEITFDSPERRTITMTEATTQPGEKPLVSKHDLHWISTDCGDLAPGGSRDAAQEPAAKNANP
jgi:predicted aspartyl protease